MRRLRPHELALYRAVAGCDAPASVILRWPWWWRDFRGLALGPLVLVKDSEDAALICHELTHVGQFREDPWRFWVRYLWACATVGYGRCRYECEARAIEERARQLLCAGPSRVSPGGA